MTQDIETLLSQPMKAIAADDFQQQVIKQIIARQTAYQKLKSRLLLLAFICSAIILAFVNFTQLPDFSWLTQLSLNFADSPQHFVLLILAIMPIIYLGIDALDG
ncbi:hypothetical protein N7931_09590 [Catenovulum sp. 2E275]|uniref:hypothetical protein n=1 Tax=Catenovulum sp. 2E275 TaxID=2980497 RepID=UPI0021D0C6B0|nr:hypothetical protein [Catenovulum sp. 2E275]MCU4675887.1 hypothetical protein [Catenovulum sp. 2E275]